MKIISDHLRRRAFAVLGVVLNAAPLSAQSFTCGYGKDPACLSFGDQVCSSGGMCVDRNAACFDTYQCNYEGFTCKSNVTDCAESYDKLLKTHNDLVDDYNDLLSKARSQSEDYETLRSCVDLATTLQDAQFCRR